MRLAEFKSQIERHSLVPTIFGYADANHYLVGAEDEEGNFYSLSDDNDNVKVFNSMFEAETCLKSLGFTSANLHLQTAYDEMIGNDKSNDTRIIINLAER